MPGGRSGDNSDLTPDDGTEIFHRADRERERRRADRARERLRRERRRRSRRRRRLLEFALLLTAFGLLTVAGAGIAATVVLSDCSLNRCARRARRELIPLRGHGTLLGSIPSSINRTPLHLWRISPWLPKATIAIEDRRFYEHGGVDYRAIVRAAIADAAGPAHRAGRLDDHSEVVRQPLHRKSERTRAGKSKRLALRTSSPTDDEAADPGGLPQRGLLRPPRFGAEAAAQTYFSHDAGRLNLSAGRAAGRTAAGADGLRPANGRRRRRRRRDEVLRAMRSAGASPRRSTTRRSRALSGSIRAGSTRTSATRTSSATPSSSSPPLTAAPRDGRWAARSRRRSTEPPGGRARRAMATHLPLARTGPRPRSCRSTRDPAPIRSRWSTTCPEGGSCSSTSPPRAAPPGR